MTNFNRTSRSPTAAPTVSQAICDEALRPFSLRKRTAIGHAIASRGERLRNVGTRQGLLGKNYPEFKPRKKFAGRASGRRIKFRCRLVKNSTVTARLADFLEPRGLQHRPDRSFVFLLYSERLTARWHWRPPLRYSFAKC